MQHVYFIEGVSMYVKLTCLCVDKHFYVQNYPQFWPAEIGVEVPYGSLAVETLDVDDNPSVIIRSFRLRRVRCVLHALNHMTYYYDICIILFAV